MKENVLDVLMYLFENYMDDEVSPAADQESLRVELVKAGFSVSEIEKAFDWLEGLAEVQNIPAQHPTVATKSFRVYTNDEMEKLDIECRGFIHFLEQVGVLDHINRELIIDRVMALETSDMDLEQLKWIILLVLFNQPGQEAAFAWMEELVFDEKTTYRH